MFECIPPEDALRDLMSLGFETRRVVTLIGYGAALIALIGYE